MPGRELQPNQREPRARTDDEQAAGSLAVDECASAVNGHVAPRRHDNRESVQRDDCTGRKNQLNLGLVLARARQSIRKGCERGDHPCTRCQRWERWARRYGWRRRWRR
eukprot:7383850-Prymnesium_polylepis.4